MKNRFIGSFPTFILIFSLFTISLPQVGFAQTSAQTATTNDIEKRLSGIAAKIEKRRKELGIPGLSVAIVKDGKTIMSKGFGYKDFEKKVPVTSDTQFAIGSATKAFTALSVLMLQDDGKLSLDDKPQKYLPYFKINDTEINEKIQIRDLLSHSSGLNRTDLGWITGKLNEEEIIRVAGEAKPAAKLRERFLYQNVMYLAAGEIVGKVQDKPWSEFVPARIFQPLGMTNSSINVGQMQKAKDYSFGYEYNFDTKQTKKLPTREISAIAPAGSINSSSDDMAKWLKFILSGGEANGKRLVSKEGFAEWIKPQMKISPDGKVSYGFGWFVQEWKGKKVVQHGGNIDGFNSMVATIPEENIGFVMLTNVSASSLGDELMQIVWSGILEDISDAPLTEEARKEIGKYRFAQAGFDIEVKIEDGKLIAIVPEQPTYTLENVEGRKYKLLNAPAGFFITFKDGEAFLEQPQGNFNLPKIGAEIETKTDDSAKELIGTYEAEQAKGNTIEIREVDGKASLVVGNQPPYPLVKKAENEFISPDLPAGFAVKAKRDADNKIAGLILVQPNGEFDFKYIGETEKTAKPKISADELIEKTIAALGGEANMKKLDSRVTKFDIDFVNQGVKGYGTTYQKAPNKSVSETTLTALGKNIGWVKDYFDGTKGGGEYSFGRDEEYTGQRLEDVKFGSNFYGLSGWKDKLKKAEVVKTDKIGDEEVYVVSLEPKDANNITLYVSTKTFLPLRQISLLVSSTSPQKIPIVENFSDYREVDGVMIPFKISSINPAMGEIITSIKEIKHNVKISDDKFRK